MTLALRFASAAALCALVLAPLPAGAIDPLRSWTQLVSSNGYTGVVLSLDSGKIHHFREHLFATEEPRWLPSGEELWEPTVPGGDCWKPRSVYSRDLLNDAYFGVRAGSTSVWLPDVDVDLDASGYDAPTGAAGDGGTGIMRMVQPLDAIGLRATTRVFAPWQYESGGFVMALELTNVSGSTSPSVTAYGLVNPNTGFGRPGPRQEIGADAETIRRMDDGSLLEQGFAGLVHMLPWPLPATTSHTPAAFFTHVRDNVAGPLPAASGLPNSGTGQAGAFEWTIGEIPAGESRHVMIFVTHDPNPDFVAGRTAAAGSFIGGREVATLLEDERETWAEFIDPLAVPDGLSADEQALWRHSAAILRMAQVRESQYWIRPQVDRDTNRFTGIDGDVAQVMGEGTIREHRGRGALLASLPPGEWAYAWVRDGSYGIVGMTDAGMFDEAELALEFFLRAHANRYVDLPELDGVPLADYALSLTRYHGFGIEESDTTCNGDFNFEWDGFGLYLWALRHYVEASGDTSLLDDYWDTIATGIADVTVGLIERDTGLMHPDSSIWEVHWFGREKTFAYTSITAVRGLCDAAALATARGETAAATRWDEAARALRQAIARRLTTPSGAIASNLEELGAGTGYWDAAVVEGVGMGLFDPDGRIATATLRAIETNLTVPSGRGVFRNDDQSDAHGLTPWGSFYDSQEWIFLDYRVSMAERLTATRDARADALQTWVRDQSLLNFLLIAENYDENTGEYRNNAPMIGFGAGSYITAMRQRAGLVPPDPACGFYYEDDPLWGPEPTTGDTTEPVDAGSDAGAEEPDVPDAGAEDADVPDIDDTDVPDIDPTDVPDVDDTDVPDVDDADANPDDTTFDDTTFDDTSVDVGAEVDAIGPGPDAAADGGVDAPSRDTGADSGGGGGGGCSASATGAHGALAFFPALVMFLRRRRGLG